MHVSACFLSPDAARFRIGSGTSGRSRGRNSKRHLLCMRMPPKHNCTIVGLNRQRNVCPASARVNVVTSCVPATKPNFELNEGELLEATSPAARSRLQKVARTPPTLFSISSPSPISHQGRLQLCSGKIDLGLPAFTLWGVALLLRLQPRLDRYAVAFCVSLAERKLFQVEEPCQQHLAA